MSLTIVLASSLGIYFLFQSYLTSALGLPPQKLPLPDRPVATEQLQIPLSDVPLPEAQTQAPRQKLYAQASFAAIPIHSSELLDVMEENSMKPAMTFVPAVPPRLEAAVRFWESIYAVYDSNQVVFHDTEDLSLVFSVLDLNDLMASPTLSAVEKERARKKAVAEEQKRLLAESPDLAGHPERLRSQTGLKDRFAKALETSGLYMDEIEKIFESYGLPWQLTRLAFVESMFHLDALSSDGAAGIWQFMRGTGRRFLKVNRYIDERYDPYLASHAAAQLLLENYRTLGTWPLAINAYNVGAGQMSRAVRQVGTRDIAKISHHYSHPAYGFASRNFYPEFLAAFRVEQNAHKYFGRVVRKAPLEYDIVRLPKGVRLSDVARLADTPVETLYTLNPALARSWWRDHRPLPEGSRVRVPAGTGTRLNEYLASR